MLTVVACGGSDDSDSTSDDSTGRSVAEPADTAALPATDPPATDPPATDPPTTEPPATDPPATDPPTTDPPTTDAPAPDSDPLLSDPAALVAVLAADELNGRDNQTEGSAEARDLLVGLVAQLADPHDAAAPGLEGHLQPYGQGTNIVGVMPGRGELAAEYVMIGAHYDHLAPGECDTRGEPDDVICNGAADNAAGVASVITIANQIGMADTASDGDDSGRRSVIIALWDGEEDGLIGASRYVDDPLVPLESTVTYVNFDIQGASLLPALENSTVLVGPETGGDALVDIAVRAVDASTLDYAVFSLIFGQGRSDHAELVRGGVPSVFFTDANNGCYHTVLDDFAHYEVSKHIAQIDTASALTFDLLTTPTPPAFVANPPLSVHDDAADLLALLRRGEADIGLLPDGGEAGLAILEQLQTVVDGGPEAYDDAAIGVVLGSAATIVDQLASSECRLPS